VKPLPDYTYSADRSEPPPRLRNCVEFIAWLDARPYPCKKGITQKKNWRAVLRKYPDGGRELTITPAFKTLTTRVHSVAGTVERADTSDSADCGGAPGGADRLDRSQEGGKRAARKVRQVCRANGMQDILALTWPGEGVHEYDRAYDALAGFIRDTKAGKFLRERGYLAVPELHPGGHGFHWHVAVKGGKCPRRMLEAIKREWAAYIWKHCRPGGWNGTGKVRCHWKHYDTAQECAGYGAKYLTKTFVEGHVAPGRQRYLRSDGLANPELLVTYSPTWYSPLLDVASPLAVTYAFEGSGEYGTVLYFALDVPSASGDPPRIAAPRTS
jgi:hypothetical protein